MSVEPIVPKATRQSPVAGQLDLEVLLSILFYGKKTFLTTVVATVGITLAASLLMPPVYEGTVKILAEPSRDQNPMALEARSPQDRKAFLETQKEMVVSKRALREALAAVEKSSEETITASQVERFASSVRIDTRATAGRAAFESSGIGESNTFFITVTQSNPEKAAELANALSRSYIQLNSSIRRDQAGTAAGGLDKTVRESTALTNAAHARLIEFEKGTGELLPELMNMDKQNVRVFPELEQMRAEFQQDSVRLERSRALIRQVEGDLSEKRLPALPPEVLIDNTQLKALYDKEVILAMELNELKPFFMPKSREIEAITEKLEGCRAEIKRFATHYLASEKANVVVIEAEQAAREATLREYETKMTNMSQLSSQYQELKREYQARARALDALIQTQADTEAAKTQSTGSGATIAIIDLASPDNRRVGPNVLRNLIIALFGGTGLGFLLVAAGHYSCPIVVHPRQIRLATGLSVVGVFKEKGGSK
jgi:uncharacterized protein involved in exopolysaccharide biosynthesis